MNATDAQIHYLECLAIDLSMDRRSRNAHISEHIGRKVASLDELTVQEASKAIDYFKQMKEDQE